MRVLTLSRAVLFSEPVNDGAMPKSERSSSRLRLITGDYVRLTQVMCSLEPEADSIIRCPLVVEAEVGQLGSPARKDGR
jgi:hypothetical protein